MGDLGQRLPLPSAGGLLSAARGCLLRGQGSFQLGLVFCGVLIRCISALFSAVL